MTTVYKYKKCNIFGFSQSVEAVLKRYEDNIYIYDNEHEENNIANISEDIKESEEIREAGSQNSQGRSFGRTSGNG